MRIPYPVSSYQHRTLPEMVLCIPVETPPVEYLFNWVDDETKIEEITEVYYDDDKKKLIKTEDSEDSNVNS